MADIESLRLFALNIMSLFSFILSTIFSLHPTHAFKSKNTFKKKCV